MAAAAREMAAVATAMVVAAAAAMPAVANPCGGRSPGNPVQAGRRHTRHPIHHRHSHRPMRSGRRWNRRRAEVPGSGAAREAAAMDEARAAWEVAWEARAESEETLEALERNHLPR